jgi:O-methyltransferase
MAVISTENLVSLISRVVDVPGDFVEIGVFRGDTFKRLALLAHALGRKAHGFDSFEGMDEPTQLDFGHYPKGKLSVGGVANFERILIDADIPKSSYKLWPGFIPHCFKGFDTPVSLAVVDVDQYEPTVVAIDWIWDRISPGGIMLLDDYFRSREGLASKAIDEWLIHQNPIEMEVFDYIDTQLYIKKLNIAPRPFPAHLLK